MIVIAEAWIYSVLHTIIQRHSGIVFIFYNQLRILFVVPAFGGTTSISLSFYKNSCLLCAVVLR